MGRQIKDKVIQIVYSQSVGDLYAITEKGVLYSFRQGDKEWRFEAESPGRNVRNI